MEARSPLPSDTSTWVAQGLISFEQAEAIEGSGEKWATHRIVEAITYPGAAGFAIAALIWYADQMLDFGFGGPVRTWPSFWIALAAAAVLAGLGMVFRGDTAGPGRASGVMLAVAVAMAELATIAAFWALEWTTEWTELLRTLLVAAVAFGAWRLRRSVPTHVVLFLAAYGVLSAITLVIRDPNPLSLDGYAPTIPPILLWSPWEAMTETLGTALVWALGAGWLYLGYRGTFRSANAAFLLGAAAVLGASTTLAVDTSTWLILLLIGTALALGAAGVHLRRTILLAGGTIGVLLSPLVGIIGWADRLPAARTWVMIYGIPGLLLLAAALVVDDRYRDTPAG